LSEEPRPFQIQKQTLNQMAEVEDARTSSLQPVDLVIEAFH